MPYLRIDTNKKMVSGDFNDKLEKTSAFVAKMLNKEEKWVMIAVNPGIPMMYGGDRRRPTAFVELKSIGLDADQCGELSGALCEFIEKEFGIDQDRIYIEFKCLEAENFGYDGATF